MTWPEWGMHPGRDMRALLVFAAVLLSGCGLTRPLYYCPEGLAPCGTGCIPVNAVCCDDGTGSTSSYCTNQATGCMKNTRDCQAVFPSGTTAKFCCGPSGTIGTNDCPEGQHHCGELCLPLSKSCCEGKVCASMTWDEGGCSTTGTRVGCGVCRTDKTCHSCAAGRCCSGDPCAGNTCIEGDACTGDTGSGGSGGGGGSSCPTYAQVCGGGGGGISVVEGYVPETCACPPGSTEGAGHKTNQLCGLPGSGYGCKACGC